MMCATTSRPAVAPAWGRRNRRPLAAAAEVAGLAGLLAVTGCAVAALSPAVLQQAPALRLRVVAASNRPADQAVKRQVRDAVVAQVAPVVRRAATLGQARRLLLADLPSVRAAARSVAGPSLPVRVRLGPDRFPARSFGLLRFPAGRYETLLVTLGAGRGHNWWTVLFPPFAFISFGPHLAVVGPERGAAAGPGSGAGAGPGSGAGGSSGAGGGGVAVAAQRSPAASGQGDPGGGGVAVVDDASRQAAPIEVRFALWDLWRQWTRNW